MKPLFTFFFCLCFNCFYAPCVSGQGIADSIVVDSFIVETIDSLDEDSMRLETLDRLELDSIELETTDSLRVESVLKKEKKGSIFSGRPGKSMLMSLVIPGAGQIYNKSYLRVPFVWGAVGGMGYLVYQNTYHYNCLRDAYKASVDQEPYTFPKNCEEFNGITDPGRLKALRDEYNNNRQLSIVGLSLVWLANGIDAFVNAHLKEFDIDEDLSIRVGTKFDSDPYNPMRMGVYVQF